MNATANLYPTLRNYTLVFLVLLFISFSVSAQKGTGSNTLPAQTMEGYKQMYDLAIKYGDYTSATQSVFCIISLDTANLTWKDTLANLFLTRGLYQQCLMLSTKLYQKQPDNDHILELLAISQQSLGDLQEALDYYKILYPRSKSLYHLYQITVLQYDLKKIDDCKKNIEAIIKDPDAEKKKIVITVRQGFQQSVPYKAAALNIKGVIAKDSNDSETEKKSFEDALKVYPDFAIAKGNLDGMNKPDDKDKYIEKNK